MRVDNDLRCSAPPDDGSPSRPQLYEFLFGAVAHQLASWGRLTRAELPLRRASFLALLGLHRRRGNRVGRWRQWLGLRGRQWRWVGAWFRVRRGRFRLGHDTSVSLSTDRLPAIGQVFTQDWPSAAVRPTSKKRNLLVQFWFPVRSRPINWMLGDLLFGVTLVPTREPVTSALTAQLD